MNREEIRIRLERIFHEVFEDETLRISDDLDMDQLKSWDSLGQIRLIAATEEAFSIRFTLEEIETLTNVGRIIDKISERN